MNKKYEEMSTVEVLDMLKDMFPNFKTQLQDAIHAYECPFEQYCKAEAAFQLDEMGFEYPEDERKELEALIAKRLFNSDTYIDGDVACQITNDAIEELSDLKKKNFIRFTFCCDNREYIILARNGREALGKFLMEHPLECYRTINGRVKDNAWKAKYEQRGQFPTCKIDNAFQNTENIPVFDCEIVFGTKAKEYHCVIRNVISFEEAFGIFCVYHPNISFLYLKHYYDLSEKIS